MPLPPREERSHILDYIDVMHSRFAALSETCLESIKLLQERRTALISAAVTGQIDVRGIAAAGPPDLTVGPATVGVA